MKIIRTPIVIIAGLLLAVAAQAQNGNPPLNLKLPATMPAAGSSAPPPAATVGAPAHAAAPAQSANAQANARANAHANDPPGTYYGDTSGAVGRPQAAADQPPPAPACDDATYNRPQVSGEVGMGVVGGNRGGGVYTGGNVTVNQAFGSCEHPTGGMSISVGGMRGQSFGR